MAEGEAEVLKVARSIARSISHQEIVFLEYTSLRAGVLEGRADDYVETSDTVEYWGNYEGSDWRVHLDKT